MATRLMDNVYVKGGYLDSNVSVTSLSNLIDKYDFDGQSIHMPEAFLSTDGVSYPVDFWYVPNGDDIKWEIKNVPAINSAEDFERFKIFCDEFKNLAGYYPIANGGEVLVDGFMYSLSFDENGNPIWIDKQAVLDETISDAIKTAVNEVTSGASEAFDTLKEIEDWINANSGSTSVGMQGPQGAAGADGAQGPQGADGADGVQGPQGAAGADGAKGADGADGAQGPQGADGAQGAAGADGKDGADGAQGPQGAQGADGKDGTSVTILGSKTDENELPMDGNSNGDGYIIEGYLYVWSGDKWNNVGEIKGPQGEKGENGADGAQGPQGAAGADGANGADGAQGPQGAAGADGKDGADGAQGPQGADGVNGADGAQGPQGADGAQGAAGADGVNGVDGAQGPQGADGVNGADGKDGADGAQGPQGAAGADGAQGPQGAKGEAGTSVKILGSKESETELPLDNNTNGDGYIINGYLYVWDGSEWDNVGEIKGPQGADGADGAQGPQGADGAQGAAGADGKDGADGAQGPQGADGAQGPQGADGAQGVAGADGKDGADGAQGPQGADGAQGAAGADGAQGPQGADGAQGVAGADGKDGADGAQGPQGADGAQGPQGADGAQGAAGADGKDGADGAQGPQGADGAQGVAGADGKDGADGAQGVAGADGKDGADGAQGPQGADGANGADGAQGPQGADGAQGPQGAAGADGANGADGAQGPQGADGAQGPQGADGAQGPQGADGVQGPQGAQGADGKDGTSVTILGSMASESELPMDGNSNGDGYIIEGYLYVWSGDKWNNVGEIKGPQGDKGETGADGAQGPQGAAGADGAQGPQGADGVDGAQGPQGADGAQGPQGAKGEKGALDEEEIIALKNEVYNSATTFTNDEISKLVGNDSGKTIRNIASEELASQLIPENAQESLDTLEEIAAWIQAHPDDAAAMNSSIGTLSGMSHTHDNKTVLDGVTAEKVAAWDAAEQNAKDYADGLAVNYDVAGAAESALTEAKEYTDELVENLKPYTSGIATDIKDYTVNVKVAESEKNFLDVNENNELEVKEITLDVAKTSKDIVVEGGQWASAVKTVYGGSVPAGTTWESFLEAMLCVEKFDTTFSMSKTFNVSCGTLGEGITGASNNSSVEVGTKVSLNAFTANNTTASQSFTVSTFDYGYKLGEDGTYTNATSYKETLTPSLKTSNDALTATFTNFVDESGNTIDSISKNYSIDKVDMRVMDGSNKVVIKQTGDTYTSSSAVTAGTIYVATNLKNYYKSDKETINTYTPSVASEDKTATASTTYTVTGYRNTFYGTTSSSNASDVQFIRSLTKSGKDISAGNTLSISTKSSDGHVRMVIASPREISTVKNATATQDLTALLVGTKKVVEVGGVDNFAPISYNVYDYTWKGAFGNDTWIITFA